MSDKTFAVTWLDDLRQNENKSHQNSDVVSWNTKEAYFWKQLQIADKKHYECLKI